MPLFRSSRDKSLAVAAAASPEKEDALIGLKNEKGEVKGDGEEEKDNIVAQETTDIELSDQVICDDTVAHNNREDDSVGKDADILSEEEDKEKNMNKEDSDGTEEKGPADDSITTRELFLRLQEWFSLPDKEICIDGDEDLYRGMESDKRILKDPGPDAAAGVSIFQAEVVEALISDDKINLGLERDDEGLLARFMDMITTTKYEAPSKDNAISAPGVVLGPEEVGTCTPIMHAPAKESGKRGSSEATADDDNQSDATSIGDGIPKIVPVVVKIRVPTGAKPNDTLQFSYRLPAVSETTIKSMVEELVVATACVPLGARPGSVIEVHIDHILQKAPPTSVVFAGVAKASLRKDSNERDDLSSTQEKTSPSPASSATKPKYESSDYVEKKYKAPESTSVSPSPLNPKGKPPPSLSPPHPTSSSSSSRSSVSSKGEATTEQMSTSGSPLENWEQWQRTMKRQQQGRAAQQQRREQMSRRGSKGSVNLDPYHVGGIGWARYQAWVETNTEEARQFRKWLQKRQRGSSATLSNSQSSSGAPSSDLNSHRRPSLLVRGRTVSRKWSLKSNSSTDSQLSLVSEISGEQQLLRNLAINSATSSSVATSINTDLNLSITELNGGYDSATSNENSSVARSGNSISRSEGGVGSSIGSLLGSGDGSGDTGSSSRAPSMDSRSSSVDHGRSVNSDGDENQEDTNDDDDNSNRDNDSLEEEEGNVRVRRQSNSAFSTFFANTASTAAAAAVYSPRAGGPYSFGITGSNTTKKSNKEDELPFFDQLQGWFSYPQPRIEDKVTACRDEVHRKSRRRRRRSTNRKEHEEEGNSGKDDPLLPFGFLTSGLPAVSIIGASMQDTEQKVQETTSAPSYGAEYEHSNTESSGHTKSGEIDWIVNGQQWLAEKQNAVDGFFFEISSAMPISYSSSSKDTTGNHSKSGEKPLGKRRGSGSTGSSEVFGPHRNGRRKQYSGEKMEKDAERSTRVIEIEDPEFGPFLQNDLKSNHRISERKTPDENGYESEVVWIGPELPDKTADPAKGSAFPGGEWEKAVKSVTSLFE